MNLSVRCVLLPAAVALLVVGPAPAVTPTVNDAAGFFSHPAVQKADQVIEDIERQGHKDLLIETFNAVPEDQAEKVRHMDAKEREHFFSQWAWSRARDAGLNGVYILICRQPAHLQIEVGNETRKKAFTMEDADRLRDRLVKAFRDKQFDQGLLDGVRFVQDTMRKNLEGTSAPATTSSRSGEAPPRMPPADEPAPAAPGRSRP